MSAAGADGNRARQLAEAALVQRGKPAGVEPGEHVRMHLCNAVECAGAAHAALRFEVAPGFADKPPGFLPQRGGHQIEPGVDHDHFRTVEPQPAVADDDETEGAAEVGRDGQRRAEAAGRLGTDFLQDAVPDVGRAQRRRRAFDQRFRPLFGFGGISQELGGRPLHDAARKPAGAHALDQAAGDVGDAIDHRIAAPRQDQQLVLVRFGVVEILAFAERFDSHVPAAPVVCLPGML